MIGFSNETPNIENNIYIFQKFHNVSGSMQEICEVNGTGHSDPGEEYGQSKRRETPQYQCTGNKTALYTSQEEEIHALWFQGLFISTFAFWASARKLNKSIFQLHIKYNI